MSLAFAKASPEISLKLKGFIEKFKSQKEKLQEGAIAIYVDNTNTLPAIL